MGIISLGAILPAAAMAMVITGFTDAELMRYVIKRIKAYVAPIARGFPVAITTYVKNKAAMNSAKYEYMFWYILYTPLRN
jgi:hypothetical protein